MNNQWTQNKEHLLQSAKNMLPLMTDVANAVSEEKGEGSPQHKESHESLMRNNQLVGRMLRNKAEELYSDFDWWTRGTGFERDYILISLSGSAARPPKVLAVVDNRLGDGWYRPHLTKSGHDRAGGLPLPHYLKFATAKKAKAYLDNHIFSKGNRHEDATDSE